MIRLLIHWFLSALSLIIVANLINGFQISGFGAAFIAAVVIGLVNGTLGFLLKIVTFPLTILTLGLFWLVINALMLEVAAALVPGFRIDGFVPAFIGAIVLSLVNFVLRALVP
jgi:putative membrane protein